MGKQNRLLFIGIAIGVIFGLVVGGALLRQTKLTDRRASTTNVSSNVALAQELNLLPDEKNTVDVFEDVAPSVVFITSVTRQMNWFSMEATEVPQGSGSGFIWDENGAVVTNYHVIANAGNLSVTL